MSEFLRIARSTLLYQDFLPVASNLLNRMLNQGRSKTKLLQQIRKLLTDIHNPLQNFPSPLVKLLAILQRNRY